MIMHLWRRCNPQLVGGTEYWRRKKKKKKKMEEEEEVEEEEDQDAPSDPPASLQRLLCIHHDVQL